MRYENSLTTSVENHIQNTLALNIIRANSRQQTGSTAREIREYLSNPATVSSPDFVIRRYIQSHHPALLEDYQGLADLTTGTNAPWDESVIRSLAGKLAKLSTEQGAKIEAKEWRNYLTGKGITKRPKAFMVAFTLQMGVEDTLDLLLALDKDPYSVRYPLDLICLFCQEVPGTYTWAEAAAMLEEFLARRPAVSDDVQGPSAGMTEQISTDLKQIFDKNLQGSNARAALLDYMVAHAAEFVSCKKGGKEYFLPGYSLRRMDMYQRLCEYLAVLYPSYQVPATEKNCEGENRDWDTNLWNARREFVTDDNGVVSLTALARAMFSDGLWADVMWNKGQGEEAFERQMREFCANYGQHMAALERLRKGGRNVEFFERRDALLMTYFLISGWGNLCASDEDADRKTADLLRDMAFSDTDFDIAVEEVLDKAERILSPAYAGTAASRFQTLCECFNMILAQLGYQNLYLPAQFDRFVLLSLLAEDPAELSVAVMSQGDWDFYYGDADDQAL